MLLNSLEISEMTRDEMVDKFSTEFYEFCGWMFGMGRINSIPNLKELVEKRDELIKLVEDFFDEQN